MSRLFHIIIFLLLSSFHGCTQPKKLKNYNGAKYSIEYPAAWETMNEDGILNFYPKENYGAVTISTYTDLDFPLDETKDFILEMSQVTDNRENVKMTKKKDVVEFYYEHTKSDLKWVTKVIRKKDDLYLLTINCETGMWDKNKSSFLKVLESFKIN